MHIVLFSFSNCERVLESDGISRIIILTDLSSDVKVLELCSRVLYILAQNFRYLIKIYAKC